MDKKDDTRRKSRNLSEKKRRDQFNMLINELSTMVSSSNRKLDKSSVLRSTISFLQNHREISVQQHNVEIQDNWKPSFLSNEEFTHLMLEALEGFIMVFLCTGRILYTSESIASLLGYLPSDICSSVFDMVHEGDRSSLYTLINSPTDNVLSLDVHMKHGPIYSQVTSSSSYELVRLIGTFHHWPSSSSPTEASSVCNSQCDSNSCSSICSPLSSATTDWPLCFVTMAKLLMPKLLRVISSSYEPKIEFTSRHSLEWTFLFLDHRAPPIIGYLPFEVLGTSGYDYYHVDDLENIASCHETLIQTGEGTSCFYRFLTKGQQWVWLQTRYFISYHQWNSKPEFIVCKNVVASNEDVQKSIRKSLKESETVARKSSFFSQTFSTQNQSACLSPILSASSPGSLSSEHSDMPSVVTPFKSNPVLFANHAEGDSSNPLATKDKRKHSQFDTESSGSTAIADQTSLPVSPVEHSSTGHPFFQHQGSSCACTSPTSIVAAVATIQPPFWENQVLSPSTTVSNLNSQCHTTSCAIEPSQVQLQDYLKRRRQTLQQQILLQQEEMRRVSEQLMLVQFAGPNTIPHSSTAYQSSLNITYPSTESINSASIKNLPQLPPSSAESRDFIGQNSRLQETPISSNSEFTNSKM